MERLTPDEAAARLQPVDTLAVPLATGQPPALLEALGERDDWEDLRDRRRCCSLVGSALQPPQGPLPVRLLRPDRAGAARQGANISFAPADFRRFEPLLEEQKPRVMATAAAPPDADGWCSLSLHAGAYVGELHARRRATPTAC